MTCDERTDPRTRDLGRRLDATEKVVVSRTLTDAPWENSRIARDLAAEVERLRRAPGRDVLVINSASVIGGLLRLDLVDDLHLALVPVLVGGGLRLFPDGVAARFHTAVRHGPGARGRRTGPATPLSSTDLAPAWLRVDRGAGAASSG
jgi:dihydrofolate reductase